MQLNVREAGRQEGPAVALLHGFMSSNGQWLANEARLGAHYRLIEFELWGHGDSPLPTPGQLSVAGYLESFEATRQRLGIEQWFLIGQSYGAGLMLSYARQYPKVCRGVVVTNSRSAFGTLPTRSRANDKTPTAADESTTVESLRQLPYHPIHARRFPAQIKAALVSSADRMDLRTLRQGGRLTPALNFRDRLDQLSVPVMVANGRYERAFQRDLKELAERYDNLLIAELDGGHSINIEAPEAFDQAVLAFFAAVSGGTCSGGPKQNGRTTSQDHRHGSTQHRR